MTLNRSGGAASGAPTMSAPIMTARSISEFVETLPPNYRERFNPAEIAAHAYIAQSRGDASVSVGTFPSREASGHALCVTAVDRPGLLSLISRALSESGYDVEFAEAFRRCVQPAEALDVFWIRPPRDELTQEGIEEFEHRLELLLDGALSEHPPAVGPADETGTTVRFLEGADGNLCTLEVETSDRSGLLYAITRALHRSEVQIVTSQIRTEERRVHDRFTIEELDGSPISPERRLAIQVAILSAL